MRNGAYHINVLMTLLLLIGCVSPKVQEDQRIDGIDWKLTEVNRQPWLHDVSIRLDGNRLTGIAPCNAYSGRREGTVPAFGALQISTTQLACADPLRKKTEQEYFAMLSRAMTIRRDKSKLVMTGPDSTMIFEKRVARGDEVF